MDFCISFRCMPYSRRIHHHESIPVCRGRISIHHFRSRRIQIYRRTPVGAFVVHISCYQRTLHRHTDRNIVHIDRNVNNRDNHCHFHIAADRRFGVSVWLNLHKLDLVCIQYLDVPHSNLDKNIAVYAKPFGIVHFHHMRLGSNTDPNRIHSNMLFRRHNQYRWSTPCLNVRI